MGRQKREVFDDMHGNGEARLYIVVERRRN